MSSSFNVKVYCKHCRGAFEAVKDLTSHEEKCPIGKMLAIEQGSITRKGTKTECFYCKESVDMDKHECKKRIWELVKMLFNGRCSEWLKGYIMTAFVNVKPESIPASNNTIEENADLMNAIITAAQPDD